MDLSDADAIVAYEKLLRLTKAGAGA